MKILAYDQLTKKSLQTSLKDEAGNKDPLRIIPPYVLAAATANDGNQNVTIPAGTPNTSQARIMIECADNACIVFFDISDADFTINSNYTALPTDISPATSILMGKCRMWICN